MTYAAELIDATMTATGLSQAALAKALGVAPPQVSKWRHKTAPIPEEKLTAMFDLARMDEAAREYYTLGVVRDTVTTTGVMRALDGVLDRIRPALARVGIITVVLLAGYALPQQANAGPKGEPEPAEALYIMRSRLQRLLAWLAKLGRRQGVGYASPLLA